MIHIHLAFPVEIVDSDLDFWALGFSGLAAVASAVAVFVAVVGANRARRDAGEARKDAQAERDLRVQIEDDRAAARRTVETEQRAERSAKWVSVAVEWGTLPDGVTKSRDLHAAITCRVVNGSTHPLSEVRLYLYPRVDDGLVPGRSGGYLEAAVDGPAFIAAQHSETYGRPGATYVGHTQPWEQLATVLTFTDFYGDSWRLDWDGTLTQTNTRKVEWADRERAQQLVIDTGAGTVAAPPPFAPPVINN